jgi:hypothetical protein
MVCGWPATKRALPFLKQHFLNPHLILIFTAVRERAVEEFNNLDEKS